MHGLGGRPRRYLIGFILLLLTVSCRATDPSIDAATAVDELVFALMEADAERAKEVTISTQWGRIDGFVRNHQPLACEDREWQESGRACVGDIQPEKEQIHSCWIRCEASGTIYCFVVKDIVVNRTEEGWKVYEWGEAGLGEGC
jgi:hypothetical protein